MLAPLSLVYSHFKAGFDGPFSVVVEGEGVDIAPDIGVLQGRLRNSETLKDLDILVCTCLASAAF